MILKSILTITIGLFLAAWTHGHPNTPAADAFWANADGATTWVNADGTTQWVDAP